MRKSGLCTKCSSQELVMDAKVLVTITGGQGELVPVQQDIQVVTYAKPSAIIFTGKRATGVRAWVCASCGYMEFYAIDPTLLKPEASGYDSGCSPTLSPEP